jgi:hypothetical protein
MKMEAYKATFLKGSKVRVVSKVALEAFLQEWIYHHNLRPEQLEYAGAITTVKEVSFYHGGDQLYVLENIPGVWNLPCIESAEGA